MDFVVHISTHFLECAGWFLAGAVVGFLGFMSWALWGVEFSGGR